MQQIVEVLPAGGPVDPQFMVGREAELLEISTMVLEGVSTALIGPRRVGKTTLGDAVCRRMESEMLVLPRVEVPERRTNPGELLAAIAAACDSATRRDEGRKLARALGPTFAGLLKSVGIDAKFDEILSEPSASSTRGVLMLPRALAEASGRSVLLFLDELQRVASHDDHGDAFLADLLDIYTGHRNVVVLADGSEERMLEELFERAQLDKLLRRSFIELRIPASAWRSALPDRFAELGLTIEDEAVERAIGFGEERPYPTMWVCQRAALNARATQSETVGFFEIEQAIVAAERELNG